MAGLALGTESAVMLVILLMAGIAIGRSAFEDVIDMTLFTGYFAVLAFKFKG